VAKVPREFLDEIAKFAAGLRRWPDWQSWFAPRARRLVREIDRPLFEQLKRNPEETVATLLREEDVTIRPAEPLHPHRPDHFVSLEEYEVYTAVCRQLDLFQFNRPDTVFEDQTDGDAIGRLISCPMLEFDEAQREYRVVESELAEGPFRWWFKQHPEMSGQYESRNQRRWALEKRFEVENRFRFVSELDEQERDLAEAAFCLSRVGFAAGAQFALVFIRYATTCAYYLVFERCPAGWKRAQLRGAWIT